MKSMRYIHLGFALGILVSPDPGYATQEPIRALAQACVMGLGNTTNGDLFEELKGNEDAYYRKNFFTSGAEGRYPGQGDWLELEPELISKLPGGTIVWNEYGDWIEVGSKDLKDSLASNGRWGIRTNAYIESEKEQGLYLQRPGSRKRFKYVPPPPVEKSPEVTDYSPQEKAVLASLISAGQLRNYRTVDDLPRPPSNATIREVVTRHSQRVKQALGQLLVHRTKKPTRKELNQNGTYAMRKWDEERVSLESALLETVSELTPLAPVVRSVAYEMLMKRESASTHRILDDHQSSLNSRIVEEIVRMHEAGEISR